MYVLYHTAKVIDIIVLKDILDYLICLIVKYYNENKHD